jgi:SAM-dependent methyltransferase
MGQHRSPSRRDANDNLGEAQGWIMDARIRYLQHRWYPPRSHPYVKFDQRVRKYLGADVVVLDAGCGQRAPVLAEIASMTRRAIGIDVSSTQEPVPGVELISADLNAIPLLSGSVDLIISRSVLEHLERPYNVFSEFSRILCVGGHVVCLTPNKWDYASIVAMCVPNSWHPAIVNATEGRSKSAVFPTFYRANTKSNLSKLSRDNGLEIASLEYLGQYPNYFMFSPLLFRLGCYYDQMLATIPLLHRLRGWILIDFVKPK